MQGGAVLRGAVERLVLFVGFEVNGAAEVGLHAGVDDREWARLLEGIDAVVGGGVGVLVALIEPTAALTGGSGGGFGAEGVDLLPARQTGDDGEHDEQRGGEMEAAVAGEFGKRVAGDGEHGR